jgi:hypothetical protein
MEQFKTTPEQKRYIKTLDCKCKKKDAKKRFKIENELNFYNFKLDRDLFYYSMNSLEDIFNSVRIAQQEKINEIEVNV